MRGILLGKIAKKKQESIKNKNSSKVSFVLKCW